MKPMLATEGSLERVDILASDDWIWQEKLDGVRLLTDGKGGWFGRDGQSKRDVPRALRTYRGVPLDGELVGGIWHIFDSPGPEPLAYRLDRALVQINYLLDRDDDEWR